jgi:hypothetical protein
VWKRTLSGRTFHFRLAGINNQNFLMRDVETGSWWQQISGKALFGPLKGQQLEPVSSDELTFGLWKQESPGGRVLLPVAKDVGKYEHGWEPEVRKLPVVVSFPGSALQSRDVLVGLEIGGEARAYPVKTILAQSPLQDRLGGMPILLVAGPDGKSVRVFVSRIQGMDVEFFRKAGTTDWLLMDSNSGGEWNFQGCAVSGRSQGECLERLNGIKDYWFDWRNYHAGTTVYQH